MANSMAAGWPVGAIPVFASYKQYHGMKSEYPLFLPIAQLAEICRDPISSKDQEVQRLIKTWDFSYLTENEHIKEAMLALNALDLEIAERKEELWCWPGNKDKTKASKGLDQAIVEFTSMFNSYVVMIKLLAPDKNYLYPQTRHRIK